MSPFKIQSFNLYIYGQQTFGFWKSRWTGSSPYNELAGADLSEQETLLPTYWGVNVSQMCLGMKIHNKTNWMSLNVTAKSLSHLVRGRQRARLNVTANHWMSLIGVRSHLVSPFYTIPEPYLSAAIWLNSWLV